MTIDWTPVVQALIALMSSAVIGAVGILVPALLQRFKIANASDASKIAANLSERVEVAAKAGSGLSYKTGTGDASVAVGVNHVLSSVPDALKELGITPEQVKKMVEARLGELMATDPTVSAGGAAVAQPQPAVVVNTAPADEPPPAPPQVEVTVNPANNPNIVASMSTSVPPVMDLGPYKVTQPRVPSFPFTISKDAKTEPPKPTTEPVTTALKHP